MPNLIVEYQRANGESVADAKDAIRKVLAEKRAGVNATFARDPDWTEEKRDGVDWTVARLRYRSGSPDQRVVLEPVVLPEAEPPVEKPKRRLFKFKRKGS